MTTPPRPATPINAISGLLAAFDQVPLVALGEAHALQEEADFIQMLIHHPAFAETVQAIVVEFGNALYQPVVDRFVAGQPVPDAELRPIWRDVVASTAGAFNAPVYEQFFRTVRAVNRTLDPTRRIRVLLGDPPIDWRQVQRKQDVWPFLDQRDAHFAAVVEREVLARGRRALLVAGSAHFTRLSEFDPHDGNTTQQIEARHPGALFVVVPHVAHGDTPPEFDAVAARLTDWPIPSLAHVAGTWLADLDPGLFFGDYVMVIGPDGSRTPQAAPYLGPDGAALPDVRFGDLVDAYLYLGPPATLTASHPHPAIYRGDEAYLAELQRRRVVMRGQPLDTAALFAEYSPLYAAL